MTAIKDEPSEVEDNYDTVHMEQNRRGKKAGGWQILGIYLLIIIHCFNTLSLF
jgi:hypothetical protein